jgi:hypothetical protein
MDEKFQHCCKSYFFLYLRPVKRNNTILQKLLAFLLLMVFLFIHVAKAVHRHERAATGFSFELKVQKSGDCAVCDYHLTKDADLQTANIESAQDVLSASCNIVCYQSRLTSSIGLSYSDRGPPALV